MAVLDRLRPVPEDTTTRELRESEKQRPSPLVLDRLKRGKDRTQEGTPTREMCWQFFRNEQYCYVNGDNYLVKQGTVTNADGSGKPRHRVRTTRNMLIDVAAHEVSAATQRVPGYEVTASSTDPDRESAAGLARMVAQWGYGQWGIRRATVKAVTAAVVADEGFLWPFFDNTIGPFIEGEDGTVIGQGDIRVRYFSADQVGWEPGLDFDESRWFYVSYAKPLEEIYELPGYFGGKLRADADAADSSSGKKRSPAKNLALVTEYLERPSIKNPNGTWVVMANDRKIVDDREYPCVDGQDRPVDEPVLHKLSYFTDPDNDRDLGLFRYLLDAQRTINDCTNKQLEHKNLTMMPQWLARVGTFGKKFRRTDEPGAVFTVTDLEGFKQLDIGQMPPALQELKDEARADIGRIAAQNDLPSQVEAGKAIVAFNERDMNRRQEFLANLADFHSRLMRHCLYLVQRHFTEDRLLRITGPFGPETRSFKGAELRGEVDVRVLPGSIEPLTKDGVMGTLQILAGMFPGQIPFEKAMQALHGVSIDSLGDGYEFQVDKQRREIKRMIALGPTLYPGATPEEWAAGGVPLVEPQDDDAVHLDVLHQYMETEAYDNQSEPVKLVFTTHEESHRKQQNEKLLLQQQQQVDMAAQQGLAQAAKPQTPPAPPDQPQAP